MLNTPKVALEAGNATADGASLSGKELRRALGTFPTGVTIITTADRELAGVTANSFASVSLSPPLVLWSLSHTSRSYRTFLAADCFAINILADDQITISQQFASSSDDKFEGVSWSSAETGSPLIDGALAYFDCRCVARYDGGDHTIMVGRVVAFARYEGNPLVFSQGRYGIAIEHPQTPVGKRSSETKRDELPILSMIAKAHYKVDLGVEERREAIGISPVVSKVLAGLYQAPPMTAEDLSRQMYLGRQEVEDALGECILRGEIELYDSGLYKLTELGNKRRRAMLNYLSQYQEEQLAGIADADLQSTRRVLEKLAIG
jgi:flavin reductase (DIM6/NTAB) family NADH-FMN oxidoreductase RutF/DNA-binding MarR family transcriptional regulator